MIGVSEAMFIVLAGDHNECNSREAEVRWKEDQNKILLFLERLSLFGLYTSTNPNQAPITLFNKLREIFKYKSFSWYKSSYFTVTDLWILKKYFKFDHIAYFTLSFRVKIYLISSIWRSLSVHLVNRRNKYFAILDKLRRYISLKYDCVMNIYFL